MNTIVPFNDLTRLPADLAEKIRSRAGDLSVSGDYILGKEVRAFETELAQYLNVDHVVGVASGTDALILALIALNVSAGDVVLTVGNAGGYATIAARSLNAEPVFVEVSNTNLQMSLANFQQTLEFCANHKLSPKALVVTHLYGQLNPEIEQIVLLSRKMGIGIVEDCAQALGARNELGAAGSFGDIATFSFYPTKNLGASGDGGALATSDARLASELRKLRQYGWGEKYKIEIPNGRNTRLDELQAAILRLKLPYLEKWNERRREIFRRYLESAGGAVRFFSNGDTQDFVAHLSVIHVRGMSRDRAMEIFAQSGIQTSIHFPIPDHKQKLEVLYKNLSPLPITEWASEECFSIPMFPELSNGEIGRIQKVLSGLDF